MSAFHGQPVSRLRYRDSRRARKNFTQSAGVTRIEVLQKDESHAGGIRQVRQQSREGFQTAGGRADSDDRKHLIRARTLAPLSGRLSGSSGCAFEVRLSSPGTLHATGDWTPKRKHAVEIGVTTRKFDTSSGSRKVSVALTATYGAAEIHHNTRATICQPELLSNTTD
jgi:hypothetical protein